MSGARSQNKFTPHVAKGDAATSYGFLGYNSKILFQHSYITERVKLVSQLPHTFESACARSGKHTFIHQNELFATQKVFSRADSGGINLPLRALMSTQHAQRKLCRLICDRMLLATHSVQKVLNKDA
jgi:hypothetical protein